MKTTIEISDSLLDEAKKLASQNQTTVRALVETGLRRVIEEQQRQQKFELKRASFKGRGLQSPMQGKSWSELRDLAYEGHGGESH